MATLYKVVETGKYAFTYSGLTYICDKIVKFSAEMGTGLYCEGTGNLYNVKGATNPVSITFRKDAFVGSASASANDKPTPVSGQNILYEKIKQNIYKTFSIEYKDISDEQNKQAIINQISGKTDAVTLTENSIYEWIEAANSGQDRDTFLIYGGIDIYTQEVNENSIHVNKSMGTIYLELFKLKGAILQAADIKRNEFKDQSFSEITFIADGMSVVVDQKDFNTLADWLLVSKKVNPGTLVQQTNIFSIIKLLDDKIKSLIGLDKLKHELSKLQLEQALLDIEKASDQDKQAKQEEIEAKQKEINAFK